MNFDYIIKDVTIVTNTETYIANIGITNDKISMNFDDNTYDTKDCSESNITLLMN